MRTLNAKDKVLARNYKRMKSYVVTLRDNSTEMTQAHNRVELISKYPGGMISYEQLPGYDE